VLALLAPGQGAQRPGQLAPWLELPGARETVGRLGEAAGLDLLRLGTTAGADELRDTAVAQPLLVATSLVAAAALGGRPGVLAGHSVGEWTAAALAGVLAEADAVRLVAARGRAMAAACAVAPTGMAAVLGGDRDEVLARLSALALEPANDNGPGQLVAAGPDAALAALAADPPAGARVRRLPVAGAFHTAHMAPALAPLALAVAGVRARDPGVVLLSNADGTELPEGREVLRRLVAQVAAPVRWDLCQARLATLGVTRVVELAPAGTLAALARRALPDADVVALDSPAALPALAAPTH